MSNDNKPNDKDQNQKDQTEKKVEPPKSNINETDQQVLKDIVNECVNNIVGTYIRDTLPQVVANVLHQVLPAYMGADEKERLANATLLNAEAAMKNAEANKIAQSTNMELHKYYREHGHLPAENPVDVENKKNAGKQQ